MAGRVEGRAVAQQRAVDLPLVLDVDGGILRTDLLHETAVAFVKTQPLRIAIGGLLAG